MQLNYDIQKAWPLTATLFVCEMKTEVFHFTFNCSIVAP